MIREYKRAVVSALLFVAAFRAVGYSTEAPNLYVGTCRNITADFAGCLKLSLTPVPGDRTKLSGFISITGFLGGSGTAEASFDANGRINLVSLDAEGTQIRWTAYPVKDAFDGEYVVVANPKADVARQVGEWNVKVFAHAGVPDEPAEARIEDEFRRRFLFDLERALNADGGKTRTTWPQVLFERVHPVGRGLSITTRDVDITWRPGSKTRKFDDVYKFAVDVTLFWTGPITDRGHTDLRLWYNTDLGQFTKFEVLRTTGITREAADEMIVDIGALLLREAARALRD